MTKILLLIRRLGVGGAERQMATLAAGLDPCRFEIIVATLYDGGSFAAEIDRAPHVKRVCLNKTGRWDLLSFLGKLHRLVGDFQPDVIYSFGPSVNLLAFLGGLGSNSAVIWGVRRSTRKLPTRDIPALINFGVEICLSYFTKAVIFNSNCGREIYVGRGYSPAKSLVVANGFDTVRFSPNISARVETRRRWGVADGERLVGLVGRLDAVKNHRMFLRTAGIICARFNSIKFLCLGDGGAAYCAELRALAVELEISKHVLWIKEEPNMAAAYNALDWLVLCSAEEGFPNAIGEAMACGVPCISTAVGDAAHIIGKTGFMVEDASPEGLARVLGVALDLDEEARASLGRRGRERIMREFSVEQMVAKTSSIIEFASGRRNVI